MRYFKFVISKFISLSLTAHIHTHSKCILFSLFFSAEIYIFHWKKKQKKSFYLFMSIRMCSANSIRSLRLSLPMYHRKKNLPFSYLFSIWKLKKKHKTSFHICVMCECIREFEFCLLIYRKEMKHSSYITTRKRKIKVNETEAQYKNGFSSLLMQLAPRALEQKAISLINLNKGNQSSPRNRSLCTDDNLWRFRL